MGNIIEARELQIERKHFYVELRENERGRFLRITEEAHGRRNSIIVPSTGVEAAARRPNELQLEIAAFQDNCPSSFHFVKRSTDVPRLQLDSAAPIDDDVRLQFEMACIERAVLDAVIQREAHHVNVLDPALLEVMREAGVPAMSVIEKCAVAVDVSLGSLVKYISDAARVESGREFCAVCVLNTMHRPEDLFDSVEVNTIARFFSRMIWRETAVVGRMPVFCGKNQVETPLQFISNRNDFVAVRHGQGTPGQEIILEIDDDQRVH
jgi:PurA ssDNA and RNA-binding protein